jgi:hypothetical protein
MLIDTGRPQQDDVLAHQNPTRCLFATLETLQ